MPSLLKPRIARRPHLERETPLVAIAAARQVVEEVSSYLDHPLPGRFAARLAHRARVNFANSTSFREKLSRPGDAGRENLYLFLRHWLAAFLHADHPALYAQLPSNFSTGKPLPANRLLSNEARLLLC